MNVDGTNPSLYEFGVSIGIIVNLAHTNSIVGRVLIKWSTEREREREREDH